MYICNRAWAWLKTAQRLDERLLVSVSVLMENTRMHLSKTNRGIKGKWNLTSQAYKIRSAVRSGEMSLLPCYMDTRLYSNLVIRLLSSEPNTSRWATSYIFVCNALVLVFLNMFCPHIFNTQNHTDATHDSKVGNSLKRRILVFLNQGPLYCLISTV